jgi:hypothetical protein
MEMQHYKDTEGNLYGFAADGSQDHLKPAGLIGITKEEAEQHGRLNFQKQEEAEFAKQDYISQRVKNYPALGEFVDAWVKNDEDALEEYRQKCLEVKAKYPKPEGL